MLALVLFESIMQTVLFSYSCCNNLPETTWLKTTEICSLTVLEATRFLAYKRHNNYQLKTIYKDYGQLLSWGARVSMFLPFHTIHWVLQARILEWAAIPSCRGPHLVRILHCDPFILGIPTWPGSHCHWITQASLPRHGCRGEKTAYKDYIHLTHSWYIIANIYWNSLYQYKKVSQTYDKGTLS